MLMRYMVLFLREPVVEPVAPVSLPGLSTGDFQVPLGAIVKDSLGMGLAVFSLSVLKAFTVVFFEDLLMF